MRRFLAFAMAVFSLSAITASYAQQTDEQALMDEKTHEFTNRGVVVFLVAAAQVSEMRCGLKGQIAKALGAAEIMGTAKKTGWDQWCKNYKIGQERLNQKQ
jgi:hypothetical protein